MKENLIKLLNEYPFLKELYENKLNFEKNSCFPAGHYYSPVVNVEELRQRQNEIWEKESINKIDGIDLRAKDQIQLVNSFKQYYNEIPFKDDSNEDQRYYFKNDFYSYTDAIFLYSMIREFAPKQIIEVGSGFSSALMLDTNELFFNNEINLTFIEPYTERLNDLLRITDRYSTSILEKSVQNVPLSTFEDLNAGDILFIDSTHVAKTGSDVNYIIFQILPRLKSGVHIHFHDIFYPFEYPKEWVFMGRNWNEAYILKAFLMYNQEFEIKLFSNYLYNHHKNAFKDLPLCSNNYGANLWIEKK